MALASELSGQIADLGSKVGAESEPAVADLHRPSIEAEADVADVEHIGHDAGWWNQGDIRVRLAQVEPERIEPP